MNVNGRMGFIGVERFFVPFSDPEFEHLQSGTARWHSVFYFGAIAHLPGLVRASNCNCEGVNLAIASTK